MDVGHRPLVNDLLSSGRLQFHGFGCPICLSGFEPDIDQVLQLKFYSSSIIVRLNSKPNQPVN
jgi:hypothetical protein